MALQVGSIYFSRPAQIFPRITRPIDVTERVSVENSLIFLHNLTSLRAGARNHSETGRAFLQRKISGKQNQINKSGATLGVVHAWGYKNIPLNDVNAVNKAIKNQSQQE